MRQSKTVAARAGSHARPGAGRAPAGAACAALLPRSARPAGGPALGTCPHGCPLRWSPDRPGGGWACDSELPSRAGGAGPAQKRPWRGCHRAAPRRGAAASARALAPPCFRIRLGPAFRLGPETLARAATGGLGTTSGPEGPSAGKLRAGWPLARGGGAVGRFPCPIAAEKRSPGGRRARSGRRPAAPNGPTRRAHPSRARRGRTRMAGGAGA